ncbi:MAG: tetratricopeptide repeat protein [Calditrichia bacterium]
MSSKKKPKKQEQSANAFSQSPNQQGDGNTQHVHYGNIINQYISGEKPLPKFLTGTPPQNAGFFGREEDLRQLETSLNDAGAVVVVNGLGGIGKTELCRHFFHEQQAKFEHLLWVDYLGNFRESLVRAIRTDVFRPREGQTLNEQFEQVMLILADLPEKSLLLVDDILDAEDADLAALRGLPLKVVTSSRLQLEGFESYPLGFLDVESCREVFYRFYNGKRDEETLDAVIDLTGQHTLTVELLAKTANHAKISIAVLFERLIDIGFNLNEALPKNVKMLWHEQVDEKKLFEHLNNVFAMDSLSEEEAYVLANLCVLPSEPMEAAILSDWLQDDISDTLTSLVAKGWLSEQEGFEVFLHPIIAAVARERLKPKAMSCNILVNSLISKLEMKPGDNPISKSIFLPYSQELFNHLNEDHLILATLGYYLGWVYRGIGKLNESLRVQLRSVAIREQLLHSTDALLADSYNDLSQIYLSLGRLDDALASQLKDLKISELLLPPDHLDLGSSYNNLSLIYRSLSRLDNALASQQKAIDIFESALPSDHPNLATSYNNLSLIFESMGRLDEALATQKKAHKIYISVMGVDHPNLATSYNNLSLIYKGLYCFAEALEMQQKSVEIRGSTLSGDHPDLAQSYHNLASIYAVMESYNFAVVFEERALQIWQKNFTGGHPHLDIAFHNLQSYREKLDETKE